jgi:hypothetical protein
MDTSLLTDPETFFQQRSENPGLLRPLVVVFLAAIASIGASVVLIQTLSTELPALFVVFQAGGVIFGFFGQFIAWVIFTILFYLISIAVGGEGSLGDTFKLTGWGFAPAIIGGIINTITYYIALQATEVPSFPEDLNLQNQQQVIEASEEMTEFIVAVTTHPAVRVATAIGILLLIWQIVIWVFGVKEARDLTTRGAVISVGFPAGLYLLFRLYSLITSLI